MHSWILEILLIRNARNPLITCMVNSQGSPVLLSIRKSFQKSLICSNQHYPNRIMSSLPSLIKLTILRGKVKINERTVGQGYTLPLPHHMSKTKSTVLFIVGFDKHGILIWWKECRSPCLLWNFNYCVNNVEEAFSACDDNEQSKLNCPS